jgi:hypothetical protein
LLADFTHRVQKTGSVNFGCKVFSEVRQERFKDHPFGGCTAPRDVVALGATAPHGSVGKGVQKMHLLQIEHRISVEQVAHTVMEEYL